MAHNERESQTLATFRDALLPKLISGELRVKEAERAIKETTV
jgi:type I restriction enzyme S subunit